MWNRSKVLSAFQRALNRMRTDDIPDGYLRPRTVALLAHALYCEDLKPGAKQPRPDTFRKFASGQLPCPDVLELLQKAHVRPLSPARLDRPAVRAIFAEAVRNLEAKLLKGRASPSHIVRQAYHLYLRRVGEAAPRPSYRTFEGLVYGKTADPEVAALMRSISRFI